MAQLSFFTLLFIAELFMYILDPGFVSDLDEQNTAIYKDIEKSEINFSAYIYKSVS